MVPGLVFDDGITAVSSFEDVRNVVFAMDASSTPGPDSFGGSFTKLIGMRLVVMFI